MDRHLEGRPSANIHFTWSRPIPPELIRPACDQSGTPSGMAAFRPFRSSRPIRSSRTRGSACRSAGPHAGDHEVKAKAVATDAQGPAVGAPATVCVYVGVSVAVVASTA